MQGYLDSIFGGKFEFPWKARLTPWIFEKSRMTSSIFQKKKKIGGKFEIPAKKIC
jgi:hypothetical protein